MKVFYIFLFSILFTSNTFSQNFLTKKGGNCYTMEIPSYLTRTYDLNDVATLQYNNTLKEAYVIVIEDSKDEMTSLGMVFLDSKEFLENFVKEYQIDAEKRTISEITKFESNQNQHAQLEMTWSSEDGDFYMLITSAETKEHFYKILCWTTAENKDKLKNDFLAIAKSIKE